MVRMAYGQVDETQRNQDVADAMRDVNENRLSKFELALLITKIIDDVTLEEVQFNFVEHFYSDWVAFSLSLSRLSSLFSLSSYLSFSLSLSLSRSLSRALSPSLSLFRALLQRLSSL